MIQSVNSLPSPKRCQTISVNKSFSSILLDESITQSERPLNLILVLHELLSSKSCGQATFGLV